MDWNLFLSGTLKIFSQYFIRKAGECESKLKRSFALWAQWVSSIINDCHGL